MMIAPPDISSKGWKFSGTCSVCTGAKVYKFRNEKYPAYELRWNMTANKWSLKKSFSYLYRNKTLSEITTVIASL